MQLEVNYVVVNWTAIMDVKVKWWWTVSRCATKKQLVLLLQLDCADC